MPAVWPLLTSLDGCCGVQIMYGVLLAQRASSASSCELQTGGQAGRLTHGHIPCPLLSTGLWRLLHLGLLRSAVPHALCWCTLFYPVPRACVGVPQPVPHPHVFALSLPQCRPRHGYGYWYWIRYCYLL
ncbi:hypothetical protein BD289DRAFT_434037 [Coniella lustricola]|uniref:Uncharacterized protein n=1 Tax=Coniella lustricola TaxID=2025994 RepID=A0A2T3A7X1_9PEZI|nr:hypothetical protein BD289DRAFT_434037 [Coniella lustricola]